MATSPPRDDHTKHSQPSPEAIESLIFDLHSFKFRISHQSLNNPANVRVFAFLDKYISCKPSKDQWALYIGTYIPFPFSFSNFQTPILSHTPQLDYPHSTATIPSTRDDMQTYYGGVSGFNGPKAPIFDPTLEPLRSILAAGGSLESVWTKACAARFAQDAKGEVAVFFNRIGADIYDRAVRSNDMATVYFESVVSLISIR
jgi:hypothetical protein